VSGIGFGSLLVIALALSADCFAVALSGGLARQLPLRRLARVPVFFGLFQCGMTLAGWLAGRSVVDYIAAYDHWLAFALLLVIGLKMIWESFKGGEERAGTDITRLWVLLTLAVATSIDALAVGLSLAFLQVNIAAASATIGATAFIITVLGLLIGRRVGALVGRRAELVGGAVLIIIGVRILLEHLL
jgi:putative Mn2+ efflux pump MntP